MLKKSFGRKPSSKYTNTLQTVDEGEQNVRRHRPDYMLLMIAVALLAVGLIVVYSISPGLASTRDVSPGYFVSKQLIAIGLGLVAFAVFSNLPLRILKASRNWLVGITAVMALVVQLFGENVNGAVRWIQIGGLSFQVAELIKFTIIVWLACFLVERIQKGEIASFDKTLKPLLIAIALIGVVVAGLESDLGSAAVMIAIIAVMALTAGLPLRRIAMIGGIVVIGLFLAIGTSEYRRDRVSTFLNPTQDCQDAGYQSCQAMIAIGSGGILGLGLGKSVQAYGYLPEAANDSIFAVLAEKFGFIGVSILLGLYVWLFSRMRSIVLRTSDLFSRLFVLGVLTWISVQALVNIGAMIGLLPLKGITLPFVSYGGTSIIFVMASLGIVFRISRYTSFERLRDVTRRGETNDYSSGRRGQRRTYYATNSTR